MPPLPDEPGVYLWEVDDSIVYVGQTRRGLRTRLGPNGYSTIGVAKTLARTAGKRDGGQETNCRINELANIALSNGRTIRIWYRVSGAGESSSMEAQWMSRNGRPEWNRRSEGTSETHRAASESTPTSEALDTPNRVASVTQAPTVVTPPSRPNSKYAPLYAYLLANGAATRDLTFRQVEEMLGFALPASALKHRAWWANGGHTHADAWLDAGFAVHRVDLANQIVAFRLKPRPSPVP